MADDVNHSIDSRRAVRDQEQRAIAETTSLMLTVTRPMIAQQRALIRLWADAFEGWINHTEQMAEAFSSSLYQQSRQQHPTSRT